LMWYIITSILLIFSFGCSTIKSEAIRVSETGLDSLNIVKHKILPKKYEPKKKVLIIPFICAWDPASKYGEKIASDFAKKIKRIPNNLLVYQPKNPSAWKIKGPIPRFGIINNPDLINDAAKLHMNYLITGVIDVMKVAQRTNGIWPFRHFDNIFESILVINVVDTITGALVESHMESEQFAIPCNKTPKEKNELFNKILAGTLPSLLRKQAKLVVEILEKESWKGKILEVYANPGKIKINAGKDVGIKEGIHFDVLSWGKKINPPLAPPFYCLGKKIGEIKVVSVKEHYSIAIPLNKAPYKAGLPIKFE